MLRLTKSVLQTPRQCSRLLLNISNNRHIRGQPKIFRQKLPKYKNTLSQLPPLTELLTSNTNISNQTAFEELRHKKLDVYRCYLPPNSNAILLDAMFSSCNIGDLLKLIDQNLYSMTSFYIAISFEALDDMLNAGMCDSETVAVSPEFQELCCRTLYKLRFFEADEVLKLIKCLSTMKIPEDTLIVQGALEMCRHLINDFEVRELEALHESLIKIEAKKQADSSLLLVTLNAIPLVKEKQLKEKRYPQDYYLPQQSVIEGGEN